MTPLAHIFLEHHRPTDQTNSPDQITNVIKTTHRTLKCTRAHVWRWCFFCFGPVVWGRHLQRGTRRAAEDVLPLGDKQDLESVGGRAVQTG